MKLVPLGDKIVLKQLEAEETKEVVMQVKVGDKVIYSKYAGTDVELEGEKYIIVKQNDILAIVE